MTKTRTCLLILFLIPSVFSAFSTTHKLNSFTTAEPQKILDIADGSKIYISSLDKAAYLARITLSTNKASTTLDKLLNNFDENGFLNGWPVNSDLTIATLNSVELTKNLTGELFVATPVMAKDTNFLVTSVRFNNTIDRSNAENTTIVFLAVYNQNSDLPAYAGFKHIHVRDIVQPKTTSISFYSYLPDDNYADLTNLNTTRRRIFSNPLKYFSSGTLQTTFFSVIDPLQFSQSMWFRSIGGFKLTASRDYVDTTTIGTQAMTVTGMSNSQLFTYNSEVQFLTAGNNRLGTSGFELTTELFTNSNLTVQLNGQGTLSFSDQVSGSQNAVNSQQVQPWPGVNLKITPSGVLAGLYYMQYFNIDGGPITQAPSSTTIVPSTSGLISTGSSTVAGNSVSSSSVATASSVISTTQSVQTTTKNTSVTFTLFSIFVTLVYGVFH